MAPDTDFDPDGLFNRNVFVKVAITGNQYPVSQFPGQAMKNLHQFFSLEKP